MHVPTLHDNNNTMYSTYLKIFQTSKPIKWFQIFGHFAQDHLGVKKVSVPSKKYPYLYN